MDAAIRLGQADEVLREPGGGGGLGTWRSGPARYSAISVRTAPARRRTIRVLVDLIRPTSGAATVLGMDAQAESVEVRRSVGYIAGEPSLYDNLTGEETLAYAASLRGRGRLAARARAGRAAGVRPVAPRWGPLSSGNRRKVAVIRAFMHDPPLLIMDEPTGGLDPADAGGVRQDGAGSQR